MHPAISVIFFTVVSGAGYGLIALLALASLFGIDGGVERHQMLIGILLGMGLISAGLFSSSFHLANPKNAWRAMSRVRTSWLAREAMLAILFYPVVGIWLLRWYLGYGSDTTFTQIMAFIVMVWAVTTNFATGMLYGCLKTIPQWNTSLTPANYIMLGLMLGNLIITAIWIYDGHPIHQTMVMNYGFLATAGALKLMYFFWIGKPKGPTINTATSFTRATVRLFDVGHTSGTFLTDEFGYSKPVSVIAMLRWVVYGFGFIVPAIILALWNGAHFAILMAISFAFTGVLVERWLFFAEARHVVTLYHGNQQV